MIFTTVTTRNKKFSELAKAARLEIKRAAECFCIEASSMLREKRYTVTGIMTLQKELKG